MTQQLFLALGRYGLWAVALNVFLNQVGFPVPALPTLIVAAAIAGSAGLSPAALFAAAVAACLLADCLWYRIGERYGIRVLKTLCRISLEPDSCVSQTQASFERWGVNSIVIAKFIPGLATIAPPMAGAIRIGWPRFILLSTLAALLWVGAAMLLGTLFAAQIQALVRNLDRVGSMVLFAALILLAGYVVFKWWERRRFYRLLRMARISVAELYALMESGAAPVIVDVRSATARELEPHWIPGALHVSPADVDAGLKDLPKDRDIILYCTCPSEATAARVAKILMNRGFKQVRPLHGGLDAWVAAGHAVVTKTAHPPPG